MTIVVAFLGAMITLAGLVGVGSPTHFRSMFTEISPRARYIMAIVIRLAMGALLWWLADELRHPHVMRILAAIAVAAAVALLLLGQDRLDRFVDWWLARSDGVMRLSGLFAAAFGAYLVYVAV